MFHIVEFIESSEVEVVPSSWVQNGACAWPSYKSMAKIHKAVTLQDSPNQSWATFRVRIIYTTDSYEEARLKLPQATVMSDLQTDEDDDRPSYTKRKNSDSDEEILSGRKRLGKKGRMEDLTEIDDAPHIPSPPMTTAESFRTPARCTDTAHPSTPRNIYSPCSTAVGNQERTGCNSSCLSLLTEVIKAQEVMKQQLDVILKKLHKQNSTLQCEDIPEPSTFDLPLSNLLDLEKLECQIKEQPEQMKKLVAYFGIIGGFSTKEAVWRILGKLLANSLAKQINWSGANQKVAFRTLTLRTVVVNAVRTNGHTKSATDKEVEKYITRWLQLAPDRDGGRKERQKTNV
nr:uncharacterized protein LOC100005637 [Danio rerio]|eukprot:XP_001344635.2 uncharacterized protein LOC100005637 [Danio rerio]